MLRIFVRGYRRLVATFVAPDTCPICLDVVPILALRDVESEDDEAHAKLRCRHRFCAECVRRYIQMKIKGRQVDEDELVCPVVECKQSIKEEDMERIIGKDETTLYRAILKRKRDEKNPMRYSGMFPLSRICTSVLVLSWCSG
ncbi:C3HC4 type zinc finger [Phytophthora infestans]|uniref:C3HC4 type zinc finger n=1 Tax=Phytophthora infestans TaxID=4787 RepID=A0A8S9TQG9_PHYIN|nr:C3HC4 type zinc finger [Phytophthora infestans]